MSVLAYKFLRENHRYSKDYRPVLNMDFASLYVEHHYLADLQYLQNKLGIPREFMDVNYIEKKILNIPE